MDSAASPLAHPADAVGEHTRYLPVFDGAALCRLKLTRHRHGGPLAAERRQVDQLRQSGLRLVGDLLPRTPTE
jgi:hypothetical protein